MWNSPFFPGSNTESTSPSKTTYSGVKIFIFILIAFGFWLIAIGYQQLALLCVIS
jgi:lipopolysaccharide export LptBFGC system permease protein LptF